MPEAAVRPASKRDYFERANGVRTSHLAGPREESTEAFVGTTEFPIGAYVALHTHDCEETVYILEGVAEFEADGLTQRLAVGDVTWTPANVSHGFSNVGDGPMRILWVYGAVTATRTIVATGRTTLVADEADRAQPDADP